nr:aromatic ring-hydroxylating dioxygenase subunit alpha [uncultured Rhodococcus sp.]
MTMARSTATHRVTATGNIVVDGPLDDTPTGAAILPARAYTDQSVLDLENDRIFSSGWSWLGFEHWVAEPGAVHPVRVGGKPLLMVKDRAGEIRVFHNACRHRGMALTEEPIQVQRRIQCAYHCWSYALDGALAAAPFVNRERGGRVEPALAESLGLLEVPSKRWAGMVFVDLWTGPGGHEPFEEALGPLIERWDHVDFDRLHLAEEREFDIGVNWKLIVENFLDFYHLPFVHPQVGPVASSLDVDDVALSANILGGTYPRGALGKAQKTEDSLPFLGDVPADRVAGQDIFCVFPNALLFLEADWFQVIGFEPISPTRTIEHMAVFVDHSASGEDYGAARKKLGEVLFGVNEQDLPILYKLQAGRRSPGSDATNLMPGWDQITAMFQIRVAEQMADGLRGTTET